MWRADACARCSSAWLRLAAHRTPRARENTAPSSSRGGMLISTLNWPSSVWKSASAIASSTAALPIAGSPASSVRLSSISSPNERRSASKRDSREHPREHVEAGAHLLAVALPVLAAEDLRGDFLSHALSVPRAALVHTRRSRISLGQRGRPGLRLRVRRGARTPDYAAPAAAVRESVPRPARGARDTPAGRASTGSS